MLRQLYLALALTMITLSTNAAIESHIQTIVELLGDGSDKGVLEEELHATHLVTRYYQVKAFKPIWVDRARIDIVLNEIGRAEEDGLNPDDYHYSYLLEQLKELDLNPSEGRQAEFEILLTDALITYGYHMLAGKIDPALLEETWNYQPRVFDEEHIINRLASVMHAEDLQAEFKSFLPDNQLHKELKRGLAHFRTLQAQHSFETIKKTPLLKAGQTHAVVPLLRRRLTIYGLLSPNDNNGSEYYDEALVSAIKQFQTLHNIDADGIIGKASWRALNMSWQERVDILRVNLERTRWLSNQSTDKLVVVNIAGYSLYYLENGELSWSTDVMIGKVDHETPIFQSRISYLEFNPNWTVPRSIITRSLIPKFKANPAYIAANDYVIKNRDGKAVDPASIDWKKINKNYFPYTVVQQPGEKNALGQVKFMFPNKHAIYLHDTPAKSLFSRSARAFSSGCVRVKNPFELAERLLASDQNWTMDDITQVVASKKRKRVNLKQPVNVMLMYWTAEPFDNDRIRFSPDIYARDKQTLKALDQAI